MSIPVPTLIWLNDEEEVQALRLGRRRQTEARRMGLKDSFGLNTEEGELLHINGARCEIAVAIATGREFEERVNTFKNADVGQRIHVRGRSKHNYELIVRQCDDPSGYFVLATSTGRHDLVNVWGWQSGKQCMDKRWLKTFGGRPPAYFVPQSQLRPITTLPKDA